MNPEFAQWQPWYLGALWCVVIAGGTGIFITMIREWKRRHGRHA
jgi:hypothetical protein